MTNQNYLFLFGIGAITGVIFYSLLYLILNRRVNCIGISITVSLLYVILGIQHGFIPALLTIFATGIGSFLGSNFVKKLANGKPVHN
jgi:hypothetical protein